MCFQHFIHFKCGCTRLEENECEYAQELDIGFWRKIDCPSYTSERSHRSSKCGAGDFYCGAIDDGPLLNTIDKLHGEAIYQRGVMLEQTLKGKQVLSQMRDEYVASGRTVQELQASREANNFWATTAWIDAERRRLEQDIQNWTAVKALAKQHHDSQQQRLRAGVSLGDSFTSYMQRSQPQAFAIIAGGSFMDDVEDIDGMSVQPDTSQHWTVAFTPQSAVASAPLKAASSQHGPSVMRDASRLGVQHGSQIITPQSQLLERYTEHATNSPTTDALHAQRMAVQSQVLAQQQRKRAAAQNAIPEVQAHQKKKLGRPFKKQKVEASPSPEKSSSRIRRSSRVKDKQVNYAVDILSEVSRSPSPVKSDVSAFSPQKSDCSYTPAKPRATVKKETSTLHDSLLGRGRVNLADQIGEWSRSDSGVSTPSRDMEPRLEVKKRKAKQDVIDETDNIIVKQESPQKQVWVVKPDARNAYRGAQRPNGEWVKQADGSYRLLPHVKTEPSSHSRPSSAPNPQHRQYREDGNAFPSATHVGAYAMPNPFKDSTMSQLHQRNYRAASTHQQMTSAAGYLAPPTNGPVYQEFGQSYEDVPMAGNVWPTDGSAASPELPVGTNLLYDENVYSDNIDWSVLDEDATV